MTLFVRRHLVSRLLKGLAFATLTILLALIGVVLLGRATGANISLITDRLLSTRNVLLNPLSDQTYLERVSKTREFYQAFYTSPLFGVAPGHSFTYERAGQEAHHTIIIVDSPMVFPAKFGILGVILLLFAARMLSHLTRQLMAADERTVPRLALLGYLVFVGILMALTAPLTDKGFGFGLLFLLLLSLPRQHVATMRERLTVGGSRTS